MPTPLYNQFFLDTPLTPLALQTTINASLQTQARLIETQLQHLLDTIGEEQIATQTTQWMQQHPLEIATLFNELTSTLFNPGILNQAMPAHDTRHALIKTPLRALAHVCALHHPNLTYPLVQHTNTPPLHNSYASLGILGAFCHDWGRWAEERILHEVGTGMTHARISACLTQEFLQSFSRKHHIHLPPFLTLPLLHSIAQHTRGATPEDPLPSQIVARADRDQLYGPEIIIRVLHHCHQSNGNECHFYFASPTTTNSSPISSFYKLSRFNTTRLQGPLHLLDHDLRLRETHLERFLLLTAPPQHLPDLHIPHHTTTEQKQKLQTTLRNQLPPAPHPHTHTLQQLITSSWCAPDPRHYPPAHARFHNLDATTLSHINQALYLTLLQRDTFDTQEHNFLQQTLQHLTPNHIPYLTASLLLQKIANTQPAPKPTHTPKK